MQISQHDRHQGPTAAHLAPGLRSVCNSRGPSNPCFLGVVSDAQNVWGLAMTPSLTFRWVLADTCFDFIISFLPHGAGFHRGNDGLGRATTCPDRPTLDNLPRPQTSVHRPCPRLPDALGTCRLWAFSTLLETSVRKSALNNV